MQFQTVHLEPLHSQTEACLIVGVFADKSLSSAAQQLDQQSQGGISQLLADNDISGELGETLLLHQLPHVSAKRILLVGCGKAEQLDGHQYRKLISKMVAALASIAATDAICCLTEITLQDKRDSAWKIQHLVQLTLEGLYRFEQLKSQKPNKNPAISKLFIPINSAEMELATKAIAIGYLTTGLISNFADFPNVGDRPAAASITAACFLSRFTQNLTWAHLDIAGTAAKNGKEKGATGRPVSMLMQYLLNRSKRENT